VVFDALGGFTVREKDRIARIERLIGAVSTSAVTSGARYSGAFGFHIVTDDALAAVAVPDPIGDEDSAWYWHQEFHSRNVDFERMHQPFDTKTKRVLNSSKMTLMFALNVDGVSDSTVQWEVYFRLLFSWK